ncbi:hypothetical protein [uncultured Oxalicibacterium sp.]|uniref:hypothetical protein n=1 Tax=uncultured Oxalicibacterium sp. TaxID=1168540 RepID=UPI0026011F43|nr:hypothetical protein [uncultured Oxalicibacterium sp.]
MSANYWRNRWIEALVQTGLERSAAEAAYAEAYKNEPADDSKSPETQAMLHVAQLGSANAGAAQRASH